MPENTQRMILDLCGWGGYFVHGGLAAFWSTLFTGFTFVVPPFADHKREDEVAYALSEGAIVGVVEGLLVMYILCSGFEHASHETVLLLAVYGADSAGSGGRGFSLMRVLVSIAAAVAAAYLFARWTSPGVSIAAGGAIGGLAVGLWRVAGGRASPRVNAEE